MKIIGHLVVEFLPARGSIRSAGQWMQIGGFRDSYEAAEHARKEQCAKEPNGSFFVFAQYQREDAR